MDYQEARASFHDYYSKNEAFLRSAEGFFRSLCESIIADAGTKFHHVSSRVKSRESCLDKFDKRYRAEIENKGEKYEIRKSISDLIGIRVICFYEKDVRDISDLLEKTLKAVAPRKDRFEERDSSPNEFGYRAIHLNLGLSDDRSTLAEYRRFNDLVFEVQIRTVIQDAWSVLDHQLQYKGHASSRLKRSINALAAVFEQADQNFAQIRGQVEVEQNEARQKIIEPHATIFPTVPTEIDKKIANEPVDVISLNELIKQQIPEFNGSLPATARFLDDIGSEASLLTLSVVTDALKSQLSLVSDYERESDRIVALSPITKLRHCLYAASKNDFKSALFDYQRKNFDSWLISKGHS